MQAFNHGMKYLIDQLAGQMLVYVAISPNVVTSQYAHMRRVACDAMSSIGDTQNTLNSTSYGWWQSHMYNFIDADHMVFGNETEGTNRARFTSGLITGTPILGDDFSTSGIWDSRNQNYAQNQELLDISRAKTAFQPIEANTGTNASELFVKQIGSLVYVAVVNYGTSSKTFNINLGRAGLSTSTSYSVKELYTATTTTVTGTLSATVPASDSRIYRFSETAPSGSRFGMDTQITVSEPTIKLYPNPAKNSILLESENTIFHSLISIEIIDTSGKKWSTSGIIDDSGKSLYIDATDLSDGIYFIRITTEKTTKVLKFIIRK